MDLAPNGLPYSRCAPAENEWTACSDLLARLVRRAAPPPPPHLPHTQHHRAAPPRRAAQFARRRRRLTPPFPPAAQPADATKTMHPCIVARPRPDVGGGWGLYAFGGIRAGEVLWAERREGGVDVTPIARSRAWIEALPAASRKAYVHYMYKTGPDEYQVNARTRLGRRAPRTRATPRFSRPPLSLQSLAEFNDVAIDEYPNVRTVDVASYVT